MSSTLVWLVAAIAMWMFQGGPSGVGAIASLLGGVGLQAVLTKVGIHV